VDVFLDAYPEQRLTGVVDRIWPTADRSKATVEVRIIVADKTLLRPEYGVRVVFRDHAETGLPVEASTQQAKVMIVPESAIVAIGGVQTAFVLERDIVQATPVTVGERKKGRVSIVAGLTPGQRIVLAPSTTLQDKDRVRLADDGDT
jgi:multidrug efflux pump subunit AcrA (membrane-fusion protein)